MKKIYLMLTFISILSFSNREINDLDSKRMEYIESNTKPIEKIVYIEKPVYIERVVVREVPVEIVRKSQDCYNNENLQNQKKLEHPEVLFLMLTFMALIFYFIVCEFIRKM